jgi:hypothetical protein
VRENACRVALSILVWLLGTSYGVLLDGQVFRGALILGCAAIACALLWAPLLRRREPPVRRRPAAVVVSLNAAVALTVAVSLPGALEQQRVFNRRSSDVTAGVPVEVGSRTSWAISYFQQNPDADPLQMIGAYNATELGKQLGYLSPNEARAIAAKAAGTTAE